MEASAPVSVPLNTTTYPAASAHGFRNDHACRLTLCYDYSLLQVNYALLLGPLAVKDCREESQLSMQMTEDFYSDRRQLYYPMTHVRKQYSGHSLP